MANNAKRTRRQNGDGHLRRRADGRIEKQLTIKSLGIRKRVSVYGRTVRELNENIDKLRGDAAKGQLPRGRAPFFSSLVEDWLGHVRKLLDEGQRSAGTWGQYEGLMRLHILPVIGKIRVNKLAVDDVRAVLEAMAAKGLSRQSRRHAWSAIRAALYFAKSRKDVFDNVACEIEEDELRVKPYRQFKIDLDEARRFLTAAQACVYGDVFRIGFPLMLRESEILGLRWRNVDLRRGKLYVRSVLEELPAKLRPAGLMGGWAIVERVKTELSDDEEEMDLGPVLAEILRQRMKTQLRARSELLAEGGTWRETIPVLVDGALGNVREVENDLVFTNKAGQPLSPQELGRHFRAICENAGIQYRTSEQHGARIHDLRGSCAVLLLTEEAGPGSAPVSPRAVMKRGRWKSWQVFKHYTEVQEKALAKVGDATEKLLFAERG